MYGAILAFSSKKKFSRKKKKVAYRLKEEYRVSNCANQSRLAGISPNIGSYLNVTLVNVLSVLSLKARGGTPQEVEEALSVDRKLSSMVFDSEKPATKGK